MVRVFGLSGLRNTYRSVLSAVGSSEISGASRWLDALLELGARRAPKSASNVAPAAARRMNAYFRIRAAPFSDGRSGRLWRLLLAVVRRSFAAPAGPVRRSGDLRGDAGTGAAGERCLQRGGGRDQRLAARARQLERGLDLRSHCTGRELGEQRLGVCRRQLPDLLLVARAEVAVDGGD